VRVRVRVRVGVGVGVCVRLICVVLLLSQEDLEKEAPARRQLLRLHLHLISYSMQTSTGTAVAEPLPAPPSPDGGQPAEQSLTPAPVQAPTLLVAQYYSVSLANCNIGDDDVRSVVNALKSGWHGGWARVGAPLRLDLRGNSVGVAGAQALLALLVAGVRVCLVDLRANKVPQEGVRLLGAQCARGRPPSLRAPVLTTPDTPTAFDFGRVTQ
jgi:hypothetical protein